MRGVFYFIGRIIAGLLLLVVLAIVIVLVGTIFALLSGNSYAGGLIMIAIIPSLFFSAPAALVASLAHRDTKKTRLWVALKAISIIAVSHVAWSNYVGPWIGEKVLSGSAAGIHLAYAIDGLVATLFMFFSGVLAAYWLPSLKMRAKPKDSPPKPVKSFERWMFVSLGIGIINAVINYKDTVNQVELAFSQNIIGVPMTGSYVIASIAASSLLYIYLTLRVSRAGSNILRNVFLVFYLVGIVLLIPQLLNMMKTNQLSIILPLAVSAIQAYALYLVFLPESSQWFKSHPVVEPLSAVKEHEEDLQEPSEVEPAAKGAEPACSAEKRSHIPAHYPIFISHLLKPGRRLFYAFTLAFSLVIGLVLVFEGADGLSASSENLFRGIMMTIYFAAILFSILTFVHLVALHYKPWRERSMIFRRYCFFFVCWFVGFTLVVMFFDPFDYTYQWRDDEIMQYLAISILFPSLIGMGLYSYERFVKASFSNN